MHQYPSTTESVRYAFTHGDGDAQYKIIRRVGAVQNADEDIVQDVALIVTSLQAEGRWAPKGESLHAWVHAVLRNCRFKASKKATREGDKIRSFGLESKGNAVADPGTDLWDVDSDAELHAILLDLLSYGQHREDEASAFVMSLSGRPHENIARHFRKRHASWSSRACKKVREHLQRCDLQRSQAK